MSETRDSISVDISIELDSLPPSPFQPSIFKIPDYLKSENENLHVPKFVSIGPIYHGKPHLHKMEHHKLWYLKSLLQSLNQSVDKYVETIKSLEKRVRGCYANPVEMSSDKFVKMLLLDGCFIVKLLCNLAFRMPSEYDDPTFGYADALIHDMLLLENQVPFFIIEELFKMTGEYDDPSSLVQGGIYEATISLIQLGISNAYSWPNGHWQDSELVDIDKYPNHLLEIIYETRRRSFDKMTPSKLCCTTLNKTWSSSFDHMTACKGPRTTLNISSAGELQEVGIKFKKDEPSKILNISFAEGVLKIPTLIVCDETESMLRNLILYEQLSEATTRYVSDYVYFFDHLINSLKDVEILRLQEIIDNVLGDDDMVNQMFKRLGKDFSFQPTFCYANVFNEVNAECKNKWRRRWKKCKADLKHKYFNSPWAYISFIAAVVLLLLTFMQTVYSALSYDGGILGPK